MSYDRVITSLSWKLELSRKTSGRRKFLSREWISTNELQVSGWTIFVEGEASHPISVPLFVHCLLFFSSFNPRPTLMCLFLSFIFDLVPCLCVSVTDPKFGCLMLYKAKSQNIRVCSMERLLIEKALTEKMGDLMLPQIHLPCWTKLRV